MMGHNTCIIVMGMIFFAFAPSTSPALKGGNRRTTRLLLYGDVLSLAHAKCIKILLSIVIRRQLILGSQDGDSGLQSIARQPDNSQNAPPKDNFWISSAYEHNSTGQLNRTTQQALDLSYSFPIRHPLIRLFPI
ncbi:hypothetical protein BD410DRAFT_258075 [Rickenella mellea]|uniref:Secreted protein n=1 Tax=Rickenella mellea TaxID=50990 RepID=A0A4Y7Q3X9_9AGAM|nr:hypothetical protein BD410DRAFT_258075 [Rickenella mellea]